MRLTTLLSRPECYIYVSGIHGCGKTYLVENTLVDYKYISFNLTNHHNIQSIIDNKPIEYIFNKDKFVVVIDDHDV